MVFVIIWYYLGMEQLAKQILNSIKIEYKTLIKSSAGFSNAVYFVDDKYVIKIAPDSSRFQKLANETNFYKLAKFDFVAKLVASGEYNGYPYLVMEQLHGVTVYSIWHTLTEQARENLVKQMCNILKNIHTMPYDYLPERKISHSMLKTMQDSFKLNIDILQKRGFDTSFVQKVYDRLPTIFAESKNGLVYNDAHFDNFLLVGDKLYIIDFDRVRYCSIDYELMIIKSMLDNPKKFASVQDEDNVEFDQYKNVYGYYQKYYPQLFEFDNFADRLFIYQFIYRLGHGYEYNRNDWIEEELKLLQQHFKE